jgi:hypothetical protein
MDDNRLKIDLTKLIDQIIPQLSDFEGGQLLTGWLRQNSNQSQIVEINLASILPEPGADEFCPRCGYETIELHGNDAFCRTCGLSWTVK